MMITRPTWALFSLFVALWGLSSSVFTQQRTPVQTSVFDLPQVHGRYIKTRSAITQRFAEGKYAEAEQLCRAAIELLPRDANSHYNLACALARQNKKLEALEALQKAVEFGFNRAQQLQSDADLAILRHATEFSDLVQAAKTAKPQPWRQTVTPAMIQDGQATVTETNTLYDPSRGLFVSLFSFNSERDETRQVVNKNSAVDVTQELRPSNGERNQNEQSESTGTKWGTPVPWHLLDLAGSSDRPVCTRKDEVGNLLHRWYKDGSAAGNHGDVYDNHDADHSNLAYAQFPQLTRIEFGPAAKRRGLDRGLQTRFLYNGITFGNASMSMVSGLYWRSLPRRAYVDSHAVTILATQYFNNHLYVYPEHRDHDPGHNGQGGGYGDLYFANSPYVIISQGSSGSDRPFMEAIACTLAAFRPEVKQLLARNHALMPTVQMIFRRSNRNIRSLADYLSGNAHPSVFDGSNVDVGRMIRMANAIRTENVPPVVKLQVVEEDEAISGVDFFDIASSERLFDTPAAVARVVRSTKYVRRIVVSAEASFDLNQQALTWHWRVLRGDEDRIQIKPLNDDGSVVELLVPYHQRQPIYPGSPISSNRVDIGVFVSNGQSYSAPGFLTFYYLENEKRKYNGRKLIESVQYNDFASGGNYVDPLVSLAKNWRDEYEYDEQNRLIGWTRIRDRDRQLFTPDGALVVRRDSQGRALEARKVRYEPKARGNDEPPTLEQQLEAETLYYEYSSAADRVGHVVRRTNSRPQ